MSSATILTRTDPKIKLEAQKSAKDLGLSLSGFINKLLKDFLTTNSREYSKGKPTPYLENILRDARRDRSHDSPTFDNAKDAVKWLEDQGI